MESPAGARPTLLVAFMIAAIQVYRRTISPILPPACRFTPSCSAYAVEALHEYGAARGSWLALRRLLRCHPGCPGGWDPVPPRGGGGKRRPDGPANDSRVPVDGRAPDRLPGAIPRTGEASC